MTSTPQLSFFYRILAETAEYRKEIVFLRITEEDGRVCLWRTFMESTEIVEQQLKQR